MELVFFKGTKVLSYLGTKVFKNYEHKKKHQL